MLRRATRYAKTYRRTSRRTAKRYLKGRRSFLSIGSRARMDPLSKRRKFNAMSSQNDDDPSVASNPQESGLSAVAPLSMVRFKDPGSSVFDYHHFVRRVKLAPVGVAAGALGTALYRSYNVAFSQIADYLQLAALYGRFRFTRFIFEFVPTYVPGISSAGVPAPLLYSNVYRAGYEDPSDTELKMLNNPQAVRNNYGSFTISCTPSAVKEEKMEDNSPAFVSDTTVTLAPWVDTTQGNSLSFFGAEVLVVNTYNVGASYDVYNVICTVYFDCDSNSF